MTARPDQCHGINAKGKRCGAFRMSNFTGKKTHLVTDQKWFCHRHKDQERAA